MDIWDRMSSKIIVRDNGCTDWTGYKDKDGYPSISFMGKNWRASRLLWTLTKGAIPEGYRVCHTCDSPSCLNLDHLFLGTPKENTADALQKGRMTGPRKIKKDMEEYILQRRKDGASLHTIAKELGVAQSTVKNYVPNGGQAVRKIDQSQVDEMKRLYLKGYRIKAIAEELGVSDSSVKDYKKRGWRLRI